jgi:type IV pilus assembly protein PilP
MNRLIPTWLLLAGLMAAVQVSAEEDFRTPSQQTKDALEKLRRDAPAAIAQPPQASGAAAPVKTAESGKTAANPELAPKASQEKANPLPQEPPDVRTGTRDPFRPFTLNVRPKLRRRENLSPLERYELGQLKLVGVIWNAGEPRAMVEDPAGLGYVVHQGTPIGPSDGTVKSITRNGILIEEFFVDLYGARKRREVSMRVLAESAE